MRNIFGKIPGFRSGQKYKMIISAIYYLLAVAMFTEGFGLGLFYLAAPFIVFSFIDLIRHKKKSIPILKALLNFAISFALIIASTAAIPDAEPASISQNDPTLVKAMQRSLESEEEDLVQASEPTIAIAVTEMPSEEITVPPSVEPTQVVSADSTFEVHFIDVGQADAILVLCDGKSMLIDGGNSEDSSLIYSYLKKIGVDHLDYIVNTHPHEDHVGGLAGALSYASVDAALASVTDYDSRAFNSFLKYLDKQNVSLTVPNVGDTLTLGSAVVEVLGPVRYSDSINNNSLVLKITYGSTSFLFVGDAEREEEQDILSKDFDLNSTVLKVGHHGSDTSTIYPFLRDIMPKYAVVSVGSNNTYGHPTENTLSRLRDADVKVLRTDMQGDIVFTSDGNSVSYTVERNRNADTLAAVAMPTPVSENKPVQTTSKPDTQKESNTEFNYMLNTNTKKFHKPDCPSIKQMSDKNKKETNFTRDEVISQKYSPCGNCNP